MCHHFVPNKASISIYGNYVWIFDVESILGILHNPDKSDYVSMTQPIANTPAVHGSSKGDQLHFSTSATSPTWLLQSLQPLQPVQLTPLFIPSLLPRPVHLIHTWGYFPAFSHFGTKGSRFGWLVEEYDQIGNEYEIRSCLIWLI